MRWTPIPGCLRHFSEGFRKPSGLSGSIRSCPCAAGITWAMTERCSLHGPGVVITPWFVFLADAGLHSSHRSPPHFMPPLLRWRLG